MTEKIKDFEENLTEANLFEYEDAKKEIENISMQKARGSILRAKARWHEQGEKSTKYFMNLEKRNYTKKYIKKLHIATGKLITDPKEILLEEKRFYEDLYTERNHRDLEDVDNEFVKPKLLPRLSQMQRESCEGKLTEEECKAVLTRHRRCPSPQVSR